MPITFTDDDIEIERICGGRKAGGQHMNKTASGIRITHIETGIVVKVVGRDQHQNLKKAKKELQKRLEKLAAKNKAKDKKARRDIAIKDQTTIRTYDYKSMTVKDHRTGKKASLKEVLEKGHIELLRE